jgi:GT2 family glycosyltransferase
MQDRVRVSVIVPHYSDLRRLAECLDALEAQTTLRGEFEIVVADNNSPEGPAAIERVIAGRARLATSLEKGAGPTRNAGARAAEGAIFAFTDCDCVPAPQWLEEGLAALGRHDVVGGGMRVSVADPERVTPVESFERVFAFDNERYVREKGFTVTANLFCRREVFEAVGGFRNGVSEDVEWCHRATAKGFSLGYADRALVEHPARQTWDELTRKWARLNHETCSLYLQRPGGRLTWLLRSLALPASAVVHAPRVLSAPRLNSPRERLGALGVLFRVRMWRFGHALSLAVKAPEAR